MSIPPKKERKYVECFKSNRSGSCNWCKIRAWNVGNKIYGMKNAYDRWLVCTDKKCYLEQGGKLTLFKSPSTNQQHISLDDMSWDDTPTTEQEQPEIPVNVNKHTPLDDNQYFACLDCGVSRVIYLWKHDNHNLRTFKDEEVT